MVSGSLFLSVFDLGSPQSEHPVKLLYKLRSAVPGVLLAGIGIAALLLGVTGVIQEAALGAENALTAAGVPTLISLAALGIGGWCLYTAWNNWGAAVAVFDRGFAVARWEDVRQIPWEDVAAVWQSITRHYTRGVYTGTTHQYTVQLTDDTRYKLDDKYQDIEPLGKALQTHIANALLPKYVAALKAGSRLEFGPLAMDCNKLYAMKKELAWDEVKSIRLHGGYLSVKQEKGWLRWAGVRVPQIPNFYIFFALLKSLATVE